MSLPSRVCSAIQRAGHAVHHAQKELASAALEETGKINAALQSGSVAQDVALLFRTLKISVGLAEEMTRINERLAEAYATAAGTAPSAAPAAGSKGPVPLGAASRPRATLVCWSNQTGRAKLRGNNARVWEMLQHQLNAEEYLGVTQAQIAKGAGIPLGSVAYSIGRLLSLALIEEGTARGTFRIR